MKLGGGKRVPLFEGAFSKGPFAGGFAALKASQRWLLICSPPRSGGEQPQRRLFARAPFGRRRGTLILAGQVAVIFVLLPLVEVGHPEKNAPREQRDHL